MPMRRDCRHYESRTYEGGEVIQRCRIDLAPEAPWRCPDDCPGFSKRMMDAGWHYGSMAQRESEPSAPEPTGEDVAALLDELQFVVNSAAPDALAEIERQERKGGLFRRKKTKNPKNKKSRKKNKKRK